MIPVLVAVICLLGFAMLFNHHQERMHRKDLLLMKRHATDYAEQHKRQ
jgi:hypothetical protein